jgi:hypothetical protein
MRPRRIRFTIRGLMIAVLVVAVLLSMPIRDLIVLILCTTVLAIMFFCGYRLAITTNGWRGLSLVGRARDLERVIHSGADISTRLCHNMPPSQHRLTLIDLMATVAAAALGMGFLSWVAPPPPGRTRPDRHLLAQRPACGYLVGPMARMHGYTRRDSGRGG